MESEALFSQAAGEYDSVQEVLNHVQESVALKIRVSLESINEEMILLEGRVKSAESIRDNYIRDRGHPKQEISISDFLIDSDDIIGCRVIVYYDRSIQLAVDCISRNIEYITGQSRFSVSENLTTRDAHKGSKFGYRATHIKALLQLPGEQFSQFGHAVPLEIQIRTLFSDAWARHSHRAIYKNSVSLEVLREFDAIAASLEIYDKHIATAVDKSSQPEKTYLSEELNWITIVDKIIGVFSNIITQSDVEALYAAYSNTVSGSSPTSFCDNLISAWEQFSYINLEQYGVVDLELKIRFCLYFVDQRKYDNIVPLSWKERAMDILYIIRQGN